MIDLNGTTVIGTTSEISENINNIISTPEGTVPFDRNFGMDMSLLDEPINLAQGLITVEIIRKVKLYEPRVNVKEVTFESDDNNNLIPKVRVE